VERKTKTQSLIVNMHENTEPGAERKMRQ